MSSQLITLKRRGFLKGVGAMIALPMMESLMPTPARGAVTATSSGKISRMVCIGSAYGFHPDNFFPSQTGKQFQLPSSLQPLRDLQSRLAIFKGLDHGVGGGHRGVKAFLTSVRTHSGHLPRYSIDELLADKMQPDTRFRSLALAIGKGGEMSWTRYGVKRGVVSSPSALFDKLFKPILPETFESREAKYATQHSILNAVMDSARQTRRKLGVADREKFEEYLNSIDETEVRIKRHQAWMRRAKPEVGEEGEVLSVDGYDDDMDYRIIQAGLMYELMLLALKTDSTRYMTLSIPGGNTRYNLPGVTEGYHALTHHGKSPDKVKELSVIETAYTVEFGKFLEKLSVSTTDRGEPLLESTTVLVGSGMGNASNHSNRNLPVMLAGGGVRPGAYDMSVDGQNQPLSNLYLSMLQNSGLNLETWGKSQANFNQVFA